MKDVLEWVRDILIAVIIAAVILVFFKPIIIQQQSMEPNFYAGDYVVTSRQAYKLFGDVQRGDVIVFKSDLLDENGNAKALIKRVIGIPGDEIEIREGDVFLNGEKIEEDYLAGEGISGEMDAVIVPEDHLFAMGDNRQVSEDSRSPRVGMVNQDKIIGKVVIRLYPLNKIKTF